MLRTVSPSARTSARSRSVFSLTSLTAPISPAHYPEKRSLPPRRPSVSAGLLLLHGSGFSTPRASAGPPRVLDEIVKTTSFVQTVIVGEPRRDRFARAAVAQR